jgi:protein-tyrosine phosphatase
MAVCYRRLPLEGLYNARDLGGYPATGGKITKYGVFVRSDAPRCLTEGDLTFLKDFGVTMSVDFRGDREVVMDPSSLAEAGWVRCLRSPAFNEQVAFAAGGGRGGPPVTSFVDWGAKYVEMAEECKGWIKTTLELFGGSGGAVLYHCTTGKDRTGIISALLLGLCGVSDEDIVADYCVSEVYLRPVYERLIDGFREHRPSEAISLTDPFFKTSPGNMAALLRHLNARYGGIRGFLSACGVPDTVIETLRNRLIGG